MRYFGVEEANRLVPLLTQVFDRVRPWALRAQSLHTALEGQTGTHDILTETLREEHEGLVQKIHEALTPLREMGLDIQDTEGVVDFRARLSGRVVSLCWRHGEPTVAHWHELDTYWHALDTRTSGRRPIENPEDFAPTYLS